MTPEQPRAAVSVKEREASWVGRAPRFGVGCLSTGGGSLPRAAGKLSLSSVVSLLPADTGSAPFALPQRRDLRMAILFRRGGLRPGLPWVLVAVAAGLASLAGIAASPVAGSTVATGTLEMKASLDVAS